MFAKKFQTAILHYRNVLEMYSIYFFAFLQNIKIIPPVVNADSQ